MIDEKKLIEEIEKLKSNLIQGACSSQVAMETRCKEEAYNEVLTILNSMQKESNLSNMEKTRKDWKEEPELKGIEKEVAENTITRIDRKRIPIELKGEIKAKFRNEFNTIWQIIDGIQFANVAKYIIERVCLHFAAWGAYHLKDYVGMRNEQKAQLDSLQEEPVSEDLEKAALLYYPKMSRISEPHGIIPADNESHYLGDANEDNRKAFKAGAEWQKTKLIKDATDVTVHIDSGGYPYIPQMELYDYANDVPLAKEGDKYKVVLIKGG